MRNEYYKNKKITLHGTAKVIAEAEAILDGIDGLESEIFNYRLVNEGEIRLKLQDAIDAHNIKAVILVDGNTVYPYLKTVTQYDQLRRSGSLEKMSDYMYGFLVGNFDIAHYDKRGYIAYYDDDFMEMKRTVLAKATTPGWYTDVQRILDHIQGRAKSTPAA